MLKRNAISLLASLSLGLGTPAFAERGAYQFNVGGTSMSCLSWRGEPVKIVSNPSAPGLGRAYSTADGKAVIELHPGSIGAFSPKVQQWWFAHECAHHQLPPQLNSEKRADCLAVKRLKRETGALTRPEALSFEKELSVLPGSSDGHLPGPERARHVLKCAGVAPLDIA